MTGHCSPIWSAMFNKCHKILTTKHSLFWLKKNLVAAKVSTDFVSFALPPQTRSVTNHHNHIPHCLKLWAKLPYWQHTHTPKHKKRKAQTHIHTHVSSVSENWPPVNTPRILRMNVWSLLYVCFLSGSVCVAVATHSPVKCSGRIKEPLFTKVVPAGTPILASPPTHTHTQMQTWTQRHIHAFTAHTHLFTHSL